MPITLGSLFEITDSDLEALYENEDVDQWCGHDLSGNAIRAIFKRIGERRINRHRRSRRSRQFQLSRGATEALLKLIPNVNNPAEMKQYSARDRKRLEELHEMAWSAWADTHPEEGPLQ